LFSNTFICIFLFFSKQLDETTAKLKITSKALENEQKKTEELLSQMLPKKIADDLKNGRTVQAGIL
jgi:guanylate cyclase soluble subunit beta